MSYRLGIDIGGTFTDFALIDDASGRLAVHKQLTTPDDPSRCVLAGTTALLEREGVEIGVVSAIVHGTTLVTNSVIERRGARTGMLVTEGFLDVLDIAMERRYDLFDLALEFAEPVVPRGLRREIDERVRYDGRVARALDVDAVLEAVRDLVDGAGIEALAICFLHSYANDAHERAAADRVRECFPALHVSVSSEVVAFMREYERWTTTTVNAYTQPLADRYLARIQAGLEQIGFPGRLLVMTASGGIVTPELARRFPVRLIESGPAAGALMSAHLGRKIGEPDLLSFDMGGTTAKGTLIRDGRPLEKYELEVARVHDFKAGSGLPLRLPVLDMIEIGAGGGSIASVDARGLLAVGPRSAGADPGPVCYRQGGSEPTLTDANVALGHLVPEHFLGGDMPLDAEFASTVIERDLARPLGLDRARAAYGVHEIINEDVARAFRMHASELGFDYRRCAMVAFGGSGPVHALRVARKLRIPRVILPPAAGVMSAIGLLVTPLSFETLRSGRVRLDHLDAAGLEAGFAPVEAQALEFLRAAGVAVEQVRVSRQVDMRFVGQGHEIEVTLPDGIAGTEALAGLAGWFHERYGEVFATTALENPLEIVNWKVRATAPAPALDVEFQPETGGAKRFERDEVALYHPGSRTFQTARVIDRYRLVPGERVEGPALVQENEATTLLDAGEFIHVDEYGNLIAELAEGENAG